MLAALIALFALGGPAHALEPTFESDLSLSYFPLGVRYSARPGLKQPLWNAEPGQGAKSAILGDTFLHASAVADFTPSYIAIGPKLTFQPAAIFDVSAYTVMSSYYGTFSSFIGYENADDPWTDEYADAAADAGLRGSGAARVYGASSTLKAKAGNVIIALNGSVESWTISTADNVVGDYVYEPASDLLLERKDQVMSGTALVLYDWQLGDGRWIYIGPIGVVRSAAETGSKIARAGVLTKLHTRDGRWSYLLLAQPYLIHPVQSVGLPFLALQARYTFKPRT